MVIHWHGGCHTALRMPKPLSGAVAHKTALEDVELIIAMARRYGDDEIARVLSKLGRRTGKGNRWTQARVATLRRKHGIAAPVAQELDPDVFNLAQATRYGRVSDTTLKRLIKAKLLNAQQVVPYAPLEIKRADLDGEPVASVQASIRRTRSCIEPPPGKQTQQREHSLRSQARQSGGALAYSDHVRSDALRRFCR